MARKLGLGREAGDTARERERERERESGAFEYLPFCVATKSVAAIGKLIIS